MIAARYKVTYKVLHISIQLVLSTLTKSARANHSNVIFQNITMTKDNLSNMNTSQPFRDDVQAFVQSRQYRTNTVRIARPNQVPFILQLPEAQGVLRLEDDDDSRGLAQVYN